MAVTGRFARAPYLRGALQLSPELAAASGVRDKVFTVDEDEPAEPAPAVVERLAVAIHASCENIRSLRPAIDRQPGPYGLGPEVIAAIDRLLALPHSSIRGVARQVGVDVGVVRQIAGGTYAGRRHAVRCPDCGGRVVNQDEPCRLCAVRRVSSARTTE